MYANHALCGRVPTLFYVNLYPGIHSPSVERKNETNQIPNEMKQTCKPVKQYNDNMVIILFREYRKK